MNIYGIKRRGGYIEYKVQYLQYIPIKNISINEQIPFVKLVEKIIDQKSCGFNTIALESELDHMVYDIYNLSEEEQFFIEQTTYNK